MQELRPRIVSADLVRSENEQWKQWHENQSDACDSGGGAHRARGSILMRGRLPKPVGERELDGNPGRRPLPKEPEYERALPVKPAKMSAAAKRIWNELVPEMYGGRVLRKVDRRALFQLAEDEALLEAAYAGVWKMQRALKGQAKKEGKPLPARPLFALLGMKPGRLAMSCLRDLAARVIIERREFGLTPSSRARLDVGGHGLADPIRTNGTLDGEWVHPDQILN